MQETMADPSPPLVCKTPIKREMTYSADSSRSKRKKKEATLTMSNKNPISILNELRSGLKYVLVEQMGPCHMPLFKVSVDVDGHTYFGIGRNKKAAKSRAAEEALKAFIQFPTNNTDLLFKQPLIKQEIDFTDDSINDVMLTGKKKNKDHTKNLNKGPVMLINESYPNAVYECVFNEGCSYNRFKVTITIGKDKFIGTGSSKKLAKTAAAIAAITKLSLTNPDMPIDSENFRKINTVAEDQEKADYIGRLIQDTFSKLMKNDIVHAKRKVLAGIVMTKGTNLEDADVISVTTGTKCISGEFISMNGTTLNDMHAEIISRRCLLLFLYEQLEMLVNPEKAPNSIFESRSDGNGYKLKANIEFHLYINTAPCGDARIFSPHEENGDIDRHPNRTSRGQLRSKIESGEGTIPVNRIQIPIQTWDGVLQGERLLTMSCSDKICKWNVVGIQGALLSHYIEPIYFKSIVLGSLLKKTHLCRAIYGRIEQTLQGLPPPYLLNRPEMFLMTSRETRQPCKTPNFSVIWSKGQEQVEIVNSNTGKLITGDGSTGISRLCKLELMRRFMRICGLISSITGIENNVPLLYCDAKNSVISYKVAKENLNQAFIKAGLGTWITKPFEQDTFEMVNE